MLEGITYEKRRLRAQAPLFRVWSLEVRVLELRAWFKGGGVCDFTGLALGL